MSIEVIMIWYRKRDSVVCFLLVNCFGDDNNGERNVLFILMYLEYRKNIYGHNEVRHSPPTVEKDQHNCLLVASVDHDLLVVENWNFTGNNYRNHFQISGGHNSVIVVPRSSIYFQGPTTSSRSSQIPRGLPSWVQTHFRA